MSRIIKKKSKKQETRVANSLNGKTTIASGALDFQKADVRTNDYLVECKYTDKEFYSLKLSIWEKIRGEAIKDGLRIPLMQIDLKGDQYSFGVLDVNDFLAMLEDNEKYNPLCKEEVLVKAKSFRITPEFIPICLSLHHIPYVQVEIGKHTLAVFHWEDFVLFA